MGEAATTEGKTQSWRPLVWALASFFLLPYFPPFDVIVPIQQTVLLLVPALAACSIVGWKFGGRAALALIWLAVAASVLLQPTVWMHLQPVAPPGSAYDQMSRAWAIILAAGFGLVCILMNSTPAFFVRGLTAAGVAFGVALAIALSSPSGIARFQHTGGEELMRRAAATIEKSEQTLQTEGWKDMTDRLPVLQESIEYGIEVERELPKHTAPLIPALLALESLAALALAWSIYHKLSRVNIGQPLSPLPEFRFNDQMIWALAVGLTLSLLPAFSDGRNAGFNLLLFFGALYVIRGLGVLVWISKGRYLFIVILSLLPQGMLLLGALALALGLGDTWLDLRRRPKAA